MENLDHIKKIKKLDKENVLGSIEVLDKQIEQGFEESKKIRFSENYKNIKNIAVAAMGGSALGPHIVKSLYAAKLDVPFEIINNYALPNYLNDNSLCILSSYSGNTEEILTAAEEATSKQLLVAGLTTGGKLGSFLKTHNFPAYIFKPKFNPSGQPRLGLGYSIAGQLGLLQSAGFLNIEDEEIKKNSLLIRKLHQKFGAATPTKKNPAKKAALELQQKNVLIVASEFLIGDAHALTNQINESAKQFAAYFELPELNHHLMEGLKYPANNKQNTKFLFIQSPLYYNRLRARYPITQKVVKKNGLAYIEFIPQSKNKTSQVFETLLWGSYLSFYLAILNNINPAEVPFVNFFKEELSKTNY